jgi:cysteine desulfurase family protein (TIGR01976 family)
MNVATLRSHFPALERIHNGKPAAYFDAPGGTQVPRAVAEAMSDYLFHHNANTHWMYPTSAETDAIILSARETLADFLGAAPNEIAFGANMTTLSFHLSRALGRMWREGDEVIVTELDHHANIAPWRALEIDRGIVVRTARMHCDTAQIDYDHLEELVSPNTKLIAIGAASNSLGTINDLQRVARIARAANALFFVDAVHLAPHALIDVKKIGCDFLACSAYKFYGPHIGILWGRFELLDTIPFPKLLPAPDEGIAGAAAAVDFLASFGSGDTRREKLADFFAAAHGEGMRFTHMLWDALSSMKRVRLYGPPPAAPRTPTISFTIEGLHADDISRSLAEDALFASSGDFYAATVCERLKVDALLRIGCACYTTEEEVGRLVTAIDGIARRG